MLYTDLENPTSNKIYQEVGYRRVGDTMQSRFPQNAASEPSTTAYRSACDTSDSHFSLARQRLRTAPQTVPLAVMGEVPLGRLLTRQLPARLEVRGSEPLLNGPFAHQRGPVSGPLGLAQLTVDEGAKCGHVLRRKHLTQKPELAVSDDGDGAEARGAHYAHRDDAGEDGLLEVEAAGDPDEVAYDIAEHEQEQPRRDQSGQDARMGA